MRFPVLFDPPALDDLLQRWRAGCVGMILLPRPVCGGEQVSQLVFCFPGCFMIVRKSAFNRLGGFPEQYSGWGLRMRISRWRLSPKLKVLNLFTKAEPLLHIDHPVTPYKAEELGKLFAVSLRHEFH